MPPPSDDENNYYPTEESPANAKQWNEHRRDLKKMGEEVKQLLTDLAPEKRFGEWDNITAVDMLMILISHNSYHTAQIVALRKAGGLEAALTLVRLCGNGKMSTNLRIPTLRDEAILLVIKKNRLRRHPLYSGFLTNSEFPHRQLWSGDITYPGCLSCRLRKD